MNSLASGVAAMKRATLKCSTQARRVAKVKITSSAVKGLPSAHLTPDARTQRYVRPSFDTDQLFASSGTLVWSGPTVVRPW